MLPAAASSASAGSTSGATTAISAPASRNAATLADATGPPPTTSTLRAGQASETVDITHV
jgi:hypothetical protein